MPVQINELIIRAVVDPGRPGGSGQRALADEVEGHAASAQDTAEIVQACVREVLRILAAQNER